MSAQLCPVCGGSGKVRLFNGCLIAQDAAHVKDEEEKTCHGCDGKGWVEIRISKLLPTTLYPTPLYTGPYWWTSYTTY